MRGPEVATIGEHAAGASKRRHARTSIGNAIRSLGSVQMRHARSPSNTSAAAGETLIAANTAPVAT